MTSIRFVDSRAALKKFIDYPYHKYADDPNWVPPLRLAEWEKFNPKKNPFYDHAQMELYLAEREAQVVGRIALIDDDLHNKTHHDNLLFFGFFEAADEAAALALFATLERRAAQLGRGRIRGPVNPSMNDGAGFQIDAFDTQPYIMMPQNPPEYPQFTEKAGFQKIKDLYAWSLEARDGLGERLERLAERAAKRQNYRIRSLDMKNYAAEVNELLNFYNEVWEDNWGQIKYTEAEAKRLASEMKRIVDPEMVLFLELDDKLAGVAVGFPDVHQVFSKLRSGRMLPTGIFHLLNKRMIINRMRLPILGVRPEYRNKGLELILIYEFYQRGVKRGYQEGECSWTLDDNGGINKAIQAAGGKPYKTYRLYQKDLISFRK